jgi:O-antigen/teichoic acid export membrane protein
MSKTITAQARKGVISLLARQAILFPFNFLTGVLLARLLSPADFGAYATVSFLVMGTGALFEGGFGAVLIQQTEDPDKPTLQTIFTVYMGISLALAIALGLVAPWLSALFHLSAQGPWLLRAMSFQMAIASLGTISTLLLERRLRYDVFARLDVINALLRGATLSLAFLGWGTWSMVVGALFGVMCRVALLWRAAPWPLGLRLDTAVLRRTIGAGAAFQGLNLTYIFRDNMTALLGGSLFGPKAVGYLNWGLSLPQTASNTFISITARVCFPAFARLKDAPDERVKLLVRALTLLNFVTFPALSLIALSGPQIVHYAYTDAWAPGLFALNCFSARMILKNVTSLFIEYLNGCGRVKETFAVTTVWTLFEWALALALLPFWHWNAIALAYMIGPVLPIVWLFLLVRKEVKVPFGSAFGLPILSTGLAVISASALMRFVDHAWTLGVVLGISLTIAWGFGALFEREALLFAWNTWRSRSKIPPLAQPNLPLTDELPSPTRHPA